MAPIQVATKLNPTIQGPDLPTGPKPRKTLSKRAVQAANMTLLGIPRR
jgi:hypothetical protein